MKKLKKMLNRFSKDIGVESPKVKSTLDSNLLITARSRKSLLEKGLDSARQRDITRNLNRYLNQLKTLQQEALYF